MFNMFLTTHHFNAEATFSVPTAASSAEADTPFVACVRLDTADGVSLGVDLVVELTTTDDTGEIKQKLFPWN